MTVRRTAIIAVTLWGTALFADEGFQPVTTEQTFLQILGDRNLSNRLYGVNLSVTPDGAIAGTGAGWDVTGRWSFQDGFFCRDMTWGDDALPYNCQLVESNGDEMRFTSDQGTGEAASFKLR